MVNSVIWKILSIYVSFFARVGLSICFPQFTYILIMYVFFIHTTNLLPYDIYFQTNLNIIILPMLLTDEVMAEMYLGLKQKKNEHYIMIFQMNLCILEYLYFLILHSRWRIYIFA